MPKIKWTTLEAAVLLAAARLDGEFRPLEVVNLLDPAPVRQSVLAVLNRHADIEKVRWGWYRLKPRRGRKGE